jgi:DNA polymerase/3'-5' exonuclease PolX
MNSTTILEYIQNLEKLNEESRTKIEQLKKLCTRAEEEKVDALNELNELKNMTRTTPSYTETTARVFKKSVNQCIADRLHELGEMTADFYKDAAYKRAATIIENLPYEVESGDSVIHLNGIGKSIANKIDEYIDEQDSDYQESVCSDSESIASSDGTSEESEESEEFISHNEDIYDMLRALAASEKDNFKKKTYNNAAETLFYLPYRVENPYELTYLKGIGKGIVKKVDEFLKGSNPPNEELANLLLYIGNLESNQFKCEAYWNASSVLKSIPDKIMYGSQVKNLPGFGKSICDKIDEFTATGTIKRLAELTSK